jgi:c(7)-type cytochrome triheme protein
MLILLVVLMVGVSVGYAATFGTKKRMLRPQEYGNVVINNYSEKSNVAPVVFQHWFHRSKYTCRLCHVDIGFAMQKNGSEIREEDNKQGLYCGACHNGKIAFGSTPENCDKCHSLGKEVKFKYDFHQFTEKFPQARFGNRIDWLKAEEQGLIKPADFLEGVSMKREALKPQKDFDIKSAILGMPDIVFSHKIHAVQNGCELCHPEIFGAKKGETKYSMQDIFAGKYCGACHEKVAFPFYDCQLCHMKPVY